MTAVKVTILPIPEGITVATDLCSNLIQDRETEISLQDVRVRIMRREERRCRGDSLTLGPWRDDERSNAKRRRNDHLFWYTCNIFTLFSVFFLTLTYTLIFLFFVLIQFAYASIVACFTKLLKLRFIFEIKRLQSTRRKTFRWG